jgi:NADH-quinone oxidoreductase subunit J
MGKWVNKTQPKNLMLLLISTIAMGLSVLMITCPSPIYSLISLIGVYIFGSMILICCGLSFLPFLVLVVSAGAVAILFLFVIMMLELKETKVSSKVFIIQGILLSLILGIFLIEVGSAGLFGPEIPWKDLSPHRLRISMVANAKNLGYILYTEYWIFVLLIGLILLLALVGAVVLTSKTSPRITTSQEILRQVSRGPGLALGQGIRRF